MPVYKKYKLNKQPEDRWSISYHNYIYLQRKFGCEKFTRLQAIEELNKHSCSLRTSSYFDALVATDYITEVKKKEIKHE